MLQCAAFLMYHQKDFRNCGKLKNISMHTICSYLYNVITCWFVLGMIPENLQEVKMRYIDYEVCDAIHYYNPVQFESMICFGHEEGTIGGCHVSNKIFVNIYQEERIYIYPCGMYHNVCTVHVKQTYIC